MTLSWQDLHYNLYIPQIHAYRPVLSGVSGWASPGETMAILGLSGAGKTTLLDALAGQDFGGKHISLHPKKKKFTLFSLCSLLNLFTILPPFQPLTPPFPPLYPLFPLFLPYFSPTRVILLPYFSLILLYFSPISTPFPHCFPPVPLLPPPFSL